MATLHREPWHLTPDRLDHYADAIARARYNTTLKRDREEGSPAARAARVEFYRARIAEMRGMRSAAAREARRELLHFLEEEATGVDTSEWTPPAVPCAEPPRRLRRQRGGS